jgi:cytochrome b subunit of formate dehydrogenase
MSLIAFLGHWPAFFSWFTGTMPTDLVKHHHAVWYEELTGGKKG